MILGAGARRDGSRLQSGFERVRLPPALWATVYRHLGIDPDVSFPDHRGRPMPILPFGEPIADGN